MTPLKTEYSKKLIALKVKSKFMANLKACYPKADELNEIINFMNEQPSFNLFICASFDFEAAKEGWEFWADISNK